MGRRVLNACVHGPLETASVCAPKRQELVGQTENGLQSEKLLAVRSPPCARRLRGALPRAKREALPDCHAHPSSSLRPLFPQALRRFVHTPRFHRGAHVATRDVVIKASFQLVELSRFSFSVLVLLFGFSFHFYTNTQAILKSNTLTLATA